MAKQDITLITASDTFQLWLNRTNELVDLMNSDVMTASIAGDTTLGNATLTGTFTADDLISNTSTTDSLSTISVINKLDSMDFVDFKSPISITSTQEKLLLLKSSSQKPAINLVNAGNANWNVTLGTSTATSPFIIEREGTLNPQFILTQDGDLTLSGKFIATSITANLTGNATTATRLAAPVNINGVAFNGSASILINTNFALSRATTNSYLLGDTFNGSVARTWSVDADSASIPNKVVVRDSAGNFSAGTITANLSGNADSATTLVGLTSSIIKLNYVSDVSSNIQAQIDGINTRIGTTNTQVGTTNTNLNLKANIASPALTGTPTAPTAPPGTNTTQIATTAFVDSTVSTAITDANAPTKTGGGASGTWGISITGNAGSATTLVGLTASIAELNHSTRVSSNIQAQFDSINTILGNNNTAIGDTNSNINLKANIASPTLTGTPAAPTAAAGTNSTQIATTQFVNNAITAYGPSRTGLNASGTWAIDITGNAATATSATTAAAGTNTTQIATTAFVGSAITAYGPTRTGLNASGTWGISISGNAATATSATSAGSAGSATNASNVPWTGVSGKPTTIGGYGITDAITTSATQANAIWIRNNAPTIYFRDTDEASAMIHVNSNLFYVLRGGVDATTWTAINGVWPMTLNLLNNDATFGGNVSAYSDERLKTNIRTVDNALDKVSNMRGVYFDRDGRASVGVIAQEIIKVLPEVVPDVANDGDYLSVSYGNIVGILIEAIKELKNEIETLKQKM